MYPCLSKQTLFLNPNISPSPLDPPLQKVRQQHHQKPTQHKISDGARYIRQRIRPNNIRVPFPIHGGPMIRTSFQQFRRWPLAFTSPNGRTGHQLFTGHRLLCRFAQCVQGSTCRSMLFNTLFQLLLCLQQSVLQRLNFFLFVLNDLIQLSGGRRQFFGRR